jgi:hypothetical protein
MKILDFLQEQDVVNKTIDNDIAIIYIISVVRLKE